MMSLALCSEQHRDGIRAVINAAAARYRGVIADDCWHDPYMSAAELDREIDDGVDFWRCVIDSRMVGVMGIQQVRGVTLVRHAYVLPDRQAQGVGAALLGSLTGRTTGRVLVGTWAAATWAIRFYERHGFRLVAPQDVAPLLRQYWNVPDRQVEESVVLEAAGQGAAAEA